MVTTHHKTAVIGVIYLAVEKYLKEYLQSLSIQSCQEFDLLLANDGMKNAEEYLADYSNSLTIHNIKGTPSEIRIKLIKITLQSGYKKVIFTDCDDTLENNRVEQTNKLLDRNEIVANEINITNEAGKIAQEQYFSNRIPVESIITKEQLCNSNMMGLSNTAATDEVLTTVVKQIESREVVAFDWLFWTIALLNNYQAKFTTSTTTNYRVYPKNIAGLPQPINKESVLRGLAIKEKHYNELSSYNSQYSHLYKIFSDTNKKSQDKKWLDEYILALLENRIEHPLWWENIKEPKQVGMI
jgi:hypothetical protein